MKTTTKKIRRVVWKSILRKLKNNRRIHRLAWNVYKGQQIADSKREFGIRIAQLSPDEYLDVFCKPNLNVIILVVDCLSNAHLSSQGYFRETTPFLDSLKSRFTAISASPWTYPSVASILTGLYPHNHNAVYMGELKDLNELNSFRKLRSDILTLPEMLFLLGYKIYFGTSIDVAFYPLRGRVIPVLFDYYSMADEVLNNFVKWVDKQKGERFFAYVHLADLHMPLNPPNKFKKFFGDPKDLPEIDIHNYWKSWDQKSTNETLREYIENGKLLYDNTLRYVDYELARLFHYIEDAGLTKSTIVIVTGDHGEEHFEHADMEAESFYDPRGIYGIGHGHNVFNETIMVPLLISGPVSDGKPDYYVSAVDIVPTIVDLLGFSHKMRFDGQSIFKHVGGRALLSEASGYGYEKKAVIIDKYKLIYSKDDRVEWLFDLEKDPEEKYPIVDKGITSMFIEKLNKILREDEERKIRETAKKKSL